MTRYGLCLIAALLLIPTLAASHPGPSQAQLNRLLAPVALYPDAVLSHLLIASTYPRELTEAHRWIRRRPHLEDQAAVAAAANQGWDPSVQALVAFPALLDRMSERRDWTRALGEAFLHNEPAVLASVQTLRRQAYHRNQLNTNGHQRIVVESNIIRVEPRRSAVIYLPYYQPREVYGARSWLTPSTDAWRRPSKGYWQAGVFWSFGTRIEQTYLNIRGFHWPDKRTLVYGGPGGHQPWQHDPSHRRGVPYRYETLNRQYGLPGHGVRNRPETLERRLQTPLIKAPPEPRERADERRYRTGHKGHSKPYRDPPHDAAHRQQAQERWRHQIEADRRRPHQGAGRAPGQGPQSNFQRSMRERLDAATQKPSITERALGDSDR